MATKLYYTAPYNHIFEEVKQAAKDVWAEVADHPSYLEEKINRVEAAGFNVEDNFMTIVAMFDINNQGKLANKLSEEARGEIRDRMIDGGNSPENIVF